MIDLKNILVATDFSEVADAALEYGRSFARQFGASLYLLHVVDEIAATNVGVEGYVANLSDVQRDIEEVARRQLARRIDPASAQALTEVLIAGAPAQGIVDYARSVPIDLIVMGTHGRSGVSRLFIGSVAERVVRLAPCPVLTVHCPQREPGGADTLTVAVGA
jgi:universal stress protein A